MLQRQQSFTVAVLTDDHCLVPNSLSMFTFQPLLNCTISTKLRLIRIYSPLVDRMANEGCGKAKVDVRLRNCLK